MSKEPLVRLILARGVTGLVVIGAAAASLNRKPARLPKPGNSADPRFSGIATKEGERFGNCLMQRPAPID